MLADILADDLQLGVLDGGEGGDGGSDDGGRQREVGVGREGLQHGVAIGKVGVCEVDGLVLAQREVGVEAEPVGGLVAGLEFYAEAVALLDVFHEGVAAAADVAVGGHLVAVEHGVEVGAGVPAALGNLVAQLEVEHGLGLHGVVAADGVLDVALGRLAVGDAGHEVGALVAVDAVVDAGLGIEEEVVLVEVHGEEVVGVAAELVVHRAELEVGVSVEVVGEVVGGFGVNGVVDLGAVVAVPLIVFDMGGSVAAP